MAPRGTVSEKVSGTFNWLRAAQVSETDTFLLPGPVESHGGGAGGGAQEKVSGTFKWLRAAQRCQSLQIAGFIQATVRSKVPDTFLLLCYPFCCRRAPGSAAGAEVSVILWPMAASPSTTAIRRLLSGTSDGVSLRIKVVPGASRSAIRGLLADRLKVTVAAPAAGGQANRAVCALLAKAFGVGRRDVAVVAGHTQPRKTVQFAGIDVAQAAACLESLLAK